MRTTIRIKDDLLKQAKKRATDEGRTLTSLVEDGLTLSWPNQKQAAADG